MVEKLIGLKIGNDDVQYRIIFDDGKICVVCKINTSKLELIYYSSTDLLEQIRNGVYEIIDEPSIVLNVEKMKSAEREMYEVRKKMMDEISAIYGPTYMDLVGKKSKPEAKGVMEKYNMKPYTFWKFVRRYLQSGCQPISLVDTRTSSVPSELKPTVDYSIKTGRPTKSGLPTGIILNDEIRGQFEEYLNRYKKGREMTLKNAYLGLVDKYYSEVKNGSRVMNPESRRPTYRQFYYYCHTHLTKKELDEIKTSRMEQRNAKRLLLGSSRKDAIRPGWIVEVDALEVDISITSVLNPEQSVGRPILYLMIDVYSSMIVAVSVSFENNSMVGLTNLLCNLADDKNEYCEKHGFKVDAYSIWKSNFIPHEMRCDRGSDFMSNKFEQVCNRLGIQRTLVPAGTGSLKGIVEQSFHQFQSSFRPMMENKGLITKRYDSNHHEQAMLNIDEFEQMLISFVLEHNRKSISNYPMGKDMIKEKIVPSPINLWEFGCKEYGEPMAITKANKNQFIYDLMPEVNATLSRKGITYKELNYITNDTYLLTEMYNLGNKRTKISVRYDPRNVSHIYYTDDKNVLRIADLNTNIPNAEDFIDMTWFEYEECLEAKKNLIAEGKEKNLQIDYDQYKIYSAIINSASASGVTVSAKNLRSARKAEKQNRNASNSLYEHMDKPKEIEATKKKTPKIEIKQSPKTEEDEWGDLDMDAEVDFDEALRQYELDQQ